MKRLAMITILTVGVLTLAACNSEDVVVESGVGDITKEDFYQELVDQNGEAVLNKMVTIQVLEDKYEVTDEEVDKRLELYKNQLGENFEMALMQEGLDEESFTEQLYDSILQEKALFEDIDVTDEEIKEKYDEMLENKQIEIKASHILVEDEDTIKDVKKQLDEGADFAELAKEYSEDEGSAVNGGDLGYFATGRMVPEFEEAAYGLEVDEISEPVKSEHGYHIIKLTDIKSLEDMTEEVRLQLLNEKVDPTEAQAKMAELMGDAEIDVKIEEFKDLFKIEVPESESEKPADDKKEENDKPEDDEQEKSDEENKE